MASRGALAAAALALTTCMLPAGCGGSDKGPPLVSISVDPDDFRARVGDAVHMYAFGTFASGDGRDVTREVSWRSSNPAAGTINGLGEFAATGAGETMITAAQGAVESLPVTVTVEPVPALPTAAHLPLGLMYQWEYTGTEVSPSGVVGADAPITATLAVTRQVVMNGSVWYEMSVRGSDPRGAPAFRYRRHDPEGLVEVHRAVTGDGWVILRLLDSSLTAGATWTDPEYPERTFTIESVTEYVEVPAGSFHNCVLVVETDPDDPHVEELSWYKAGFGMVKWQRYDRREHVAVHEQRLVRARFGP